MEEKIMSEVGHTIEDIRIRMEDRGELKDVDKYFDLPDLNVIWGLVAAIRFERGFKWACKSMTLIIL